MSAEACPSETPNRFRRSVRLTAPIQNSRSSMKTSRCSTDQRRGESAVDSTSNVCLVLLTIQFLYERKQNRSPFMRDGSLADSGLFRSMFPLTRHAVGV